MKYIKQFELFEKKQTGVIYHFTDAQSLLRIIEQDKMKAGTYDKGISFTRNPDLKKWYQDYSAICRIAFNGSDLSDKYRIMPYLYNPQNFVPLQDEDLLDLGPLSYEKRKEMFGDEWEERIHKDEIIGIKKYIIQVDVPKDAAMSRLDREDLKKVESLGITVNYVPRMAPVKSDSI